MNISKLVGRRTLAFTGTHARWPELIGIELELEGVENYPETLPQWTAHADDSLRDGIEYVFSSPYGGNDITVALDEFYSRDIEHSSTPRSSTHIHVNMSDSNTEVFRSMVVLTYAIEPAIYELIGVGRKWAGYSMPLSEMHPKRLASAVSFDEKEEPKLPAVWQGDRRTERYYGMNWASLRNHGTIEYRYFTGGPSREELESWIDLVIGIKTVAKAVTVERLMDRVNNEEELYNILAENGFPLYWLDKFRLAVAPGLLLNAFEEVIALAGRDSTLERNEPIVFVTPSLLRYAVKNLIIGDAAKAYIEDIASRLQVMSRADWHYHLNEAARMRARANRSQEAETTDSEDAEVRFSADNDLFNNAALIWNEAAEVARTPSPGGSPGSETFDTFVRATPRVRLNRNR